MQELTRILLLGKTGSGKSATGNSILGRKGFTSVSSTTQVTKEIEVGYGQYNECIYQVVDTPGVMDSGPREEQVMHGIAKIVSMAIAANPKGYDAFIFVVKYGSRFGSEDKQCHENLKHIFGDNFVKKSILVVTCGDLYHSEDTESESFEDWCSAQVGVFHDLIVECRNRVVLFDNRTKEPDTKTRQLKRLFHLIDSLDSDDKKYSIKYFEMAEKRKEILLDFRFSNYSEEILINASLVIQEYRKTQQTGSELKLINFKSLLSMVNRLLKCLEEQDCTSDTSAMLHIARDLKETLQNLISLNSELKPHWKRLPNIYDEKSKMSEEQQNDEWETFEKMRRLNEKRFESEQETESLHKELERKISELEFQYTMANNTFMRHVTREVGAHLLKPIESSLELNATYKEKQNNAEFFFIHFPWY